MFDEVANTLRASENPRLRVGVSFVFNTLETPTNILAQSLRRLLAASEESGVPVLVTLDGQNWWQHRPDLWNWWDPSLPGYNPSNVFNVEWTGWSPTQAVKVCWRNWGTQMPRGARAEPRQPGSCRGPSRKACARCCRSSSSGSGVCPRRASGCSAASSWAGRLASAITPTITPTATITTSSGLTTRPMIQPPRWSSPGA